MDHKIDQIVRVTRKLYDHGWKYTILRLWNYTIILLKKFTLIVFTNIRINVTSKNSEDRTLSNKRSYICSKLSYTRILLVMIVYLSKVVYFSSSFTLPPNHLFTSDRRTDRNQDGGRTGKPGLIIIWTIDLGNRSFKVSKWPILGWGRDEMVKWFHETIMVLEMISNLYV